MIKTTLKNVCPSLIYSQYIYINTRSRLFSFYDAYMHVYVQGVPRNMTGARRLRKHFNRLMSGKNSGLYMFDFVQISDFNFKLSKSEKNVFISLVILKAQADHI